MGIKDKTRLLSAKLKLGPHYGIERLGVLFSFFVLTGALVLATSGFAAYRASRADLNDKALYTPSFTTSKTKLDGRVDGVWVSSDRTSALVMMHFDPRAQISHNAADYKAFLLGANAKLTNIPLATPGVTGSAYVFGSTGYVGVRLSATAPFASQVLNLTMRSAAELAVGSQATVSKNPGEETGDASFRKYDQWQVFFNPGAAETKSITSLDAQRLDLAEVFYQTVVADKEAAAREALDAQLLTMRADLAQITAYTGDLATTKVDGLSLRPPAVPDLINGDKVTGKSAAESTDGHSSLMLRTTSTMPGGFNLDWRSRTVFDGYLQTLVPTDESYVAFLAGKAQEPTHQLQISDLKWILSDGTDLAVDTSGTSMTLRPLVTVMNNLSQAYQSYYADKQKYQDDLTLALLSLDVDLRDVATNTSVNSNPQFLVVFH